MFFDGDGLRYYRYLNLLNVCILCYNVFKSCLPSRHRSIVALSFIRSFTGTNLSAIQQNSVVVLYEYTMNSCGY